MMNEQLTDDLTSLFCQDSTMTDNPINIEHQDWLVIPPELRDGITAKSLGKRQLRNWSLVLQSRQIPWRTEQSMRGWQLLVPATHFSEACQELRSYEELNRNWPPPLPETHQQQENTAATIWLLIALGLFHILTQQRIALFGHTPVDWYLLGNADAGKILAGEWWRLVTALTLHSGGVHLAGNIVVGGIFINRLCRDLGSGLGWSLVILSGLLGNLANAFVQSPDHQSIGASTAVFGAVGLLAAINMLRYRFHLRRRWPLPVAAALGLLALLGVGGENTDIGAHLFGFCFGIGLGIATGFWINRSGSPSTAGNRSLATGSFCLMILCWWLSLQSG
jgi:membrane associated rhomboid family serine protease